MQSMESPFQITRADEHIEEEAIGVFKAQTSKNTSYVDCTNTEKMALPSSKTSSQQNYKLRNLLFKDFSKSTLCRAIRCVPIESRLNLSRKFNSQI
jgi:hypothetical protein